MRIPNPRRLLTAACLATPLLVTAPAPAAPVQLRFQAPAATTAPTNYNVTPYLPSCAQNVTPCDSNTPSNSAPYVQYARDDSAATPESVGTKGFKKKYGLDYDNSTPLEGDVWVDYAALSAPGRPAELPVVMLLHGGIMGSKTLDQMRPKGSDPWLPDQSDPCTYNGRWGGMMKRWVDNLTSRGYIVFNGSFRRGNRALYDTFTEPLLAQSTGLFSFPKPAGPGDCLPDNKPTDPNQPETASDDWETIAKESQISAQLAVRSLKWMMKGYAQRYTGVAAAQPTLFENASRKVVVFGHSYGGHLATRLALRSEDDESAGTTASRRISGAATTGTFGECTASNPARTWQRVKRLSNGQWESLVYPLPFANCDEPADPATDAPIVMHQARPYYQFAGQVEFSQLCGPSQTDCANGWGDGNLGWDRALDNRWPAGFCTGQNAGGSSPHVPNTTIARCQFAAYPVMPTGYPHNDFPFSARNQWNQSAPGGGGYHANAVTNSVDGLFRNAQLPSYPW